MYSIRHVCSDLKFAHRLYLVFFVCQTYGRRARTGAYAKSQEAVSLLKPNSTSCNNKLQRPAVQSPKISHRLELFVSSGLPTTYADSNRHTTGNAIMDQDTGEDRRTVLIAFSIFMALGDERTRMQGEIEDLRGVKRENERLKEEIMRLKDVSRHFRDNTEDAGTTSTHESEFMAWKTLLTEIARQEVREEAKQDARCEVNEEAKQEIQQAINQEVKTEKQKQATTEHRKVCLQQSDATTNSPREDSQDGTTPHLGKQAVWEIRRIRHVHEVNQRHHRHPSKGLGASILDDRQSHLARSEDGEMACNQPGCVMT